MKSGLHGVPRLQQDDLLITIVGFLSHKFVFTADIAKMYRQIKIDADYQRIIWRKSNDQPFKHYYRYIWNNIS